MEVRAVDRPGSLSYCVQRMNSWRRVGGVWRQISLVECGRLRIAP